MFEFMDTTTKYIRYIKTENVMIGYTLLAIMMLLILTLIVTMYFSFRISNKELKEFKKL